MLYIFVYFTMYLISFFYLRNSSKEEINLSFPEFWVNCDENWARLASFFWWIYYPVGFMLSIGDSEE